MTNQPTMRAMTLEEFGGPDVLRENTIERPTPSADTVVVELAYAGVNPADWKSREGWLSQYFEYKFPFVLGFDGAGRVAELGKDVTGLSVGDRVVLASNQGKGERGTYAQFVNGDAERVIRLPDNVPMKDAAAMPTAAITAHEAVHYVGKVKPGQYVLVNGGAGGTGGYAIQLAKEAGAHVAATCGPDNIAYVQSLGADLAINYREQDVAKEIGKWVPDGIDLLIDTVGQGSLPQGVAMTRSGGIVAPIATLIEDEEQHDFALAEEKGVSIVHTIANYEHQSAQLRELVAMMADGRLTSPKIETMPLIAAGAAHERVEDGHVRGKLVLEINAALDA